MLVLSFPRGRALIRLGVRSANLWYRLKRIASVRIVHPEARIEEAVEGRGFTLACDRPGLVWRVVAFERAGS